MKKGNLWAIIASFAVALIVSVIQAVTAGQEQLDRVAAMAAADSGKTWVAVYEENDIVFNLIDNNGVRQKSFSISRESGGYMVQIAHMTVDSEGAVYFIKHYTGTFDGKYSEKQELAIYTPKFLPFGRLKNVRLDSEEEPDGIRYLSTHVSTSVVVTGISEDGGSITRKTYDADSLRARFVTVKNQREYPADAEAGMYRIVASGSDVAYISQTGKVFLSVEDGAYPVQIYPEEDAQISTYASFIQEATAGQVIVGEQKSGNILRLYTDDGSVEYLVEGGRAFGTHPYTGKDVLEMSFYSGSDTSSWTAAVMNKSTGASELLVSYDGEVTLVTSISSGIIAAIFKVALNTVVYFVAIAALVGAVVGIRKLIIESRTVFLKLIFVSIPLLVLALVLFGAYSSSTYQDSLLGTYETKTADQGNLLRALFSSASFDKITAPELYGSVEYTYLRAQMGTRDVYTSSAYFVENSLYIGVDWNLPCLYPFGIRHSASAHELYRMAALTGKQQSGVISDSFGERIVSVTPVGSSSGDTVFLLETGIFRAEIDRQTSGFIRNYLLISALCLISACALLLAAFLRILRPLGGIIEVLNQFSIGNRTVRLESKTNDELADIARVFNKMAKDIDVQIYTLRTMGETYYRFVPRQIFRMLGKENLADVGLESAVEGEYYVLVANMYERQGRADFSSTRELTNRFFAIVHKVAGETGATLIPNSAGLRNIRLVCVGGGEAVQAAMNAIALIDEHNAGCPLANRLDVSFFLHRAQIGFGICGDGERYVPALISTDLDRTLARCEDFRRLSSRLIVTDAAYEALDAGKYFHRFIGYAGDGDDRTGLYDFYDSSSPNIIRLLNDTLDAFNKAMALYEQNRYYDAKNMFAVVLRENQYDNVARHYVFQCEKNL